MNSDEIASLWRETSMTQVEIAERLGVSPGALAGAIYRARAAGDLRFTARAPRKPPPAVKRKPLTAAPTPKPAPVIAPMPVKTAPGRKPVRFSELKHGECRWPLNSVAPGQTHLFVYCGEPVAMSGSSKGGSPYCERHHRASVSPSTSPSLRGLSPREPGEPRRTPESVLPRRPGPESIPRRRQGGGVP
jgi:hypothetical protein